MQKTTTLASALERSLTFEDYIALIEQLHEEEKATSFQDDPAYYEYSKMGLSRMKRIVKRAALLPELVDAIKAIDAPQTWLLITESWCGDASQTVPVIARAAQENEAITLRIALRDSEPELMEFYLTNGGQSIPILALLDADLNEIGRWGPRPAEAQQVVMDYKALPEPRPPHSELTLQVQKWYNADKGQSTQRELLSLLHSL